MKMMRITQKKMKTKNICIPGSKSLTNRALLLAALGPGTTVLKNVLESEDTLIMVQCLRDLGISVHQIGKGKFQVDGNTWSTSNRKLYVGNAGTVARFLLPVLASLKGVQTVFGDQRMHERPVAPLVDALKSSGAVIRYLHKEGFFPLEISGGRLMLQNEYIFPPDMSSQFVSAMMYLAPIIYKDVCIRSLSNMVSLPYIHLTAKLFQDFGVSVRFTANQDSLTVSGSRKLKPSEYLIESDFSSASYFFAAAAISAEKIEVNGLKPKTFQGDAVFLDYLRQMGCDFSWSNQGCLVFSGTQSLKPIQVNLSHCTDIAPSLAAVCLFADGFSRLTGLENMKYKESNRVEVIAKAFRQLGANIECDHDSWTIVGNSGGELYVGAELDPCNDHRMAMTFAALSQRIEGISIINPDCVSKTFPNFYSELFG